MHIPPTERNPAGLVTTRTGHCARNPSGSSKLKPTEVKKMWKELILLVPIFLNISCATAVFVESKHIRDLRSEFPFGLLTDDYGLLTRDDLAIDACNATPVQFSENSTSYSYWQCFDSENSKLFCEGSGYDEEEKTQLTVMVLSGVLGGNLHEYITTRAIPLIACKEFLKDWNRLLQGERYVCISGSFTHRTKDQAGRWKWLWTFDRFKTSKGCEPYFFGGCSLRYQIDHGCKIKGLALSEHVILMYGLIY